MGVCGELISGRFSGLVFSDGDTVLGRWGFWWGRFCEHLKGLGASGGRRFFGWSFCVVLVGPSFAIGMFFLGPAPMPGSYCEMAFLGNVLGLAILRLWFMGVKVFRWFC